VKKGEKKMEKIKRRQYAPCGGIENGKWRIENYGGRMRRLHNIAFSGFKAPLSIRAAAYHPLSFSIINFPFPYGEPASRSITFCCFFSHPPCQICGF
jgi:hypothetical protein